MRRALLIVLLLPAVAAADTTPLSALPSKVRYGRADGALHATIEPQPPGYTVRRGEGATCVLSDLPDFWVDGDSVLYSRAPYLYQLGLADEFGIERLVVRGDTAEIERVRATITTGAIQPLARSRVPLQVVAKQDGLVAYAYRWGSKVLVVTRMAGEAALRSDDGMPHELAPDCGFVYALLQVRNGSSQVAQLRGVVPGTGKAYVIQASVSQTGRDPEPLLSVTARVLGP